MEGYFQTDDLQYLKMLEKYMYHIIEARYAEDKYLICRAVIDLDDYINSDGTYTDDCIDTIKAYYGSVEEFHDSYLDEDTRKQILAEMIFEELPYYDTCWELVPEEGIKERLKLEVEKHAM